MILERVDLREFGAHPIGQTESVAGCAVVIAGRKSLNMEPTDPACRQDNGLGGHNDMALVVEVFENGAGTVPLLVACQLDRGAKLK